MARWLSDRAKEAVRRRDSDADGLCRCVYCQHVTAERVHNSNPLACSIDHIDTRISGGALKDPNNLVAACAGCNSSRKDKDLDTWLAGKGGGEEARARIQERLARNVSWASYIAAAKAAGFKA